MSLTRNNSKLSTIPETKPMFRFTPSISWANIMEEENDFFQPYDIMNWEIKCANFLNEEPINSYDNPENDISEFPNPLGETVYYNQDDEEYIQENICLHCDGMQDDYILIEVSPNGHCLCTECFYQEKQKANRQNTQYEMDLRKNIKNPQRYQFISPSGNIEKLNFKLHIPHYNHTGEIMILQGYK